MNNQGVLTIVFLMLELWALKVDSYKVSLETYSSSLVSEAYEW